MQSAVFEATGPSDLVRQALQGRAQAFEIIVRQHNRRLFRAARGIIRDDSEAEDIVQATYVRAFAALDRLTAPENLTTWLTRIAINEALSRLRQRRHVVGSLDDIDDPDIMNRDDLPDLGITSAAFGGAPENEAARAQMRVIVEQAIDSLPVGFRSVFVLRAVEELSVEETAACLDIPEATVKTRFHRAKERLRAYLEQRVDITLPDAFAFDGPRCDRITANVLSMLNRNTP